MGQKTKIAGTSYSPGIFIFSFRTGSSIYFAVSSHSAKTVMRQSFLKPPTGHAMYRKQQRTSSSSLDIVGLVKSWDLIIYLTKKWWELNRGVTQWQYLYDVQWARDLNWKFFFFFFMKYEPALCPRKKQVSSWPVTLTLPQPQLQHASS